MEVPLHDFYYLQLYRFQKICAGITVIQQITELSLWEADFCKMFDNIILDKHYANLMSDDRLQFGYKNVHQLYYVLHY